MGAPTSFIFFFPVNGKGDDSYNSLPRPGEEVTGWERELVPRFPCYYFPVVYLHFKGVLEGGEIFAGLGS